MLLCPAADPDLTPGRVYCRVFHAFRWQISPGASERYSGPRQNVVHGMRRIIGAMRGGAGAALLTDRFYHVAPHMSIGNFPRRRKHAMTGRQAAAACDGTKSTRHDHVNNRSTGQCMQQYEILMRNKPPRAEMRGSDLGNIDDANEIHMK